MTRALAILLLVSWGGLTGCSDTGLSRVSFTLRAGGVERGAGGPLTFINALGWEVTLTEARIAVGPVYFNLAPPLSSRQRWRPGRWLLREARADTTQDHLAGGRIVGQVLRRRVVDALAPGLADLGPGDGVSEEALSAEAWLLPEGAGAQDEGGLPAGAVAVVAGTAQKTPVEDPMNERVPFVAVLPLGEAEAQLAGEKVLAQLRMARRIPVSVPLGQDGQDGGVVTLRVDPRPWLEVADFGALRGAPVDGQGRRVAQPGDGVMRSLLRGVRLSQGVYRFAWAQ